MRYKLNISYIYPNLYFYLACTLEQKMSNYFYASETVLLFSMKDVTSRKISSSNSTKSGDSSILYNGMTYYSIKPMYLGVYASISGNVLIMFQHLFIHN